MRSYMEGNFNIIERRIKKRRSNKDKGAEITECLEMFSPREQLQIYKHFEKYQPYIEINPGLALMTL